MRSKCAFPTSTTRASCRCPSLVRATTRVGHRAPMADRASGSQAMASRMGRLPELRSVSVGFWVGVGSRDEHDHEFGASHFLEHLLFKGTADRSAAQIAHAVESVGGDMNAFTAQEMTAFYVRVPDEQLDLALDILADVVWSPALRANDVDAERHVT